MRTIQISEETFDRIKDQISSDDVYELDSYDDLIGKKFFFRTVTYHLVGRVAKRIGNVFELSDASWVADSGRFMQAIKEGKLSEVEPVGQAFLNMQSVTDFFPWHHDLPNQQE